MPTVSAFTTLLGQFLCGLLLLPLIAYIVSHAVDPATLDPATYFGNAIVHWKAKEGREYITALMPAAVVAGYVIGVIIDAFGHAVDVLIFERLWTREKSIPPGIANVISRLSTPHMKTLEIGDYIQSVFYNNCSSHILSYHSEQWSYYEFFRNILLVSASYISFLVWTWTAHGYPHWSVFIGLSLLCILMVYIMSFTARYYYKIEAYLVLGWLDGKCVDALAPKDKILSDLQLPVLSPDKSPST